MTKPLVILSAVLGVSLFIAIILAAVGLTKSCGSSSGAKIVGGDIAKEGSVPYQASLHTCKTANGEADGRVVGCGACGAVILTKDWVLTAAHCILDKHEIDAGEHDICDGLNEGGDRIEAEKAITHEDYTEGFRHLKNDIALLKLKTPLRLDNEKIKAICLPEAANTDYSGLEVTITGWGATVGYSDIRPDNQTTSCKLKEAFVKVLSEEDSLVTEYAGGSSEAKKGGRLFAFKSGVDTCQGDSGGPIAMRTPGGQDVLLGLTSYGEGCASVTPGVYAKVQDFLPWIKKTIKDNGGPEYQTPDECEKQLKEKGTLASVGNIENKNYPNNVDHNYPIIGKGNGPITVEFESFNVEGPTDKGCPYDYVTVVDVSGEILLDKTCGGVLPPPITSITNKINVHLHSDSSEPKLGFKLNWSQKESTGMIYTSHDEYPEKFYPNNIRTVKRLQVREGKKVKITINAFELEGPVGNDCLYDFVKIGDPKSGEKIEAAGATTRNKYCGKQLESGTTFTSPSNRANIVFKSDFSDTQQGFKMTYEEVN